MMRHDPRIGKEYGVNARTIRRDAEYATAVDKAESIVPGFKDSILSGSVKVTKKLLKDVCALQDGLISEALQAIKNGDIQDAESLIQAGKSIQKRNSAPKMDDIKDVDFEPVITEQSQTAEAEPPPVSVHTPPLSYNGGGTKEYRNQRDKIAHSVSELYDSSSVPKYTAQDLAEEIRFNAETWVKTLRNIIADRGTLLTDETRPEIAKAINEYMIRPIISISRNVSVEELKSLITDISQ